MDEETVLEGKRVKSRRHDDVILGVNCQSKRAKRFTVLKTVTCLKGSAFKHCLYPFFLTYCERSMFCILK